MQRRLHGGGVLTQSQLPLHQLRWSPHRDGEECVFHELWAGLGNPGAKYSLQRHNVGFMAADIIAEVHDLGPWQKKFRSLIAEGRMAKNRILLLKPQTFMNDSGDAVQQALRFYAPSSTLSRSSTTNSTSRRSK